MEGEKPERQFVMMIGLPGAGKSTYIKEHAQEFKGWTIISADLIIEEIYKKIIKEKKSHKTVNEIRSEEQDFIEKEFYNRLNDAVDRGDNILIEGVNESVEKRAKRLSYVKECKDYKYETKAIFVNPPQLPEYETRLLEKTRKKNLADDYVTEIEPLDTKEFDIIDYVNGYKQKGFNPTNYVDKYKTNQSAGASRF